ncbi:MAG: hypothetical protein ACYC0F_05285 [Rhodanobacter sp.]
MASFCNVLTPDLVYAGPRTREEFDAIPLPEMVHPWQRSKVETLLRADGMQYESCCHSKTLGEFGSDTVTVIFQWFEYRAAASAPMEAEDAQDPVLPELARRSEPGSARGLETEAEAAEGVGGSGMARRMVVGGAR